MKTSDFVFIGIKGSVVALDRATGQQVWATHLKGSDFVNVVLQGGSILASCYGEIFCLDPLTGDALWHNPLKGFGLGLAIIAMEHNAGSGNAVVLARNTAAMRRLPRQPPELSAAHPSPDNPSAMFQKQSERGYRPARKVFSWSRWFTARGR